MLIRRLEIFPLIIMIYNNAVETLPKRFGIKEGVPLEFPVIEFYYKNNDGNLTWINDYHLYSLRITTPDEIKQISRLASKVNAILRSLCTRRELCITSLQLEFGKTEGTIYLADELSPKTCHFIDSVGANKATRERFIPNGKENSDAYAELFDRLSLKV